MRSDSEGVIQPGVAAGHSCAEKKRRRVDYSLAGFLLFGVDFCGERLLSLVGCAIDPSLCVVEPG